MRAALLLALLAAPAAAQQIDCAAPKATPEITYCEGLALEAADADLNAAYADAVAGARAFDTGDFPAGPLPAEEQLRDAQRAWIAFRDAACSAEAALHYGGTGANLVFLSCQRRLTEARTADLRIYAEAAP